MGSNPFTVSEANDKLEEGKSLFAANNVPGAIQCVEYVSVRLDLIEGDKRDCKKKLRELFDKCRTALGDQQNDEIEGDEERDLPEDDDDTSDNMLSAEALQNPPLLRDFIIVLLEQKIESKEITQTAFLQARNHKKLWGWCSAIDKKEHPYRNFQKILEACLSKELPWQVASLAYSCLRRYKVIKRKRLKRAHPEIVSLLEKVLGTVE